ncbi:MAG: LacI family DNA-binding transcriptional regulator [Spirochaetales bacterium]|nr:LacI family DNA-binding transcriptional regulator [Spirochaetales bacterium]
MHTKSNKKIHTIEDIARLAGVSKSTVSRALSNSPLINEQTREKICAIAKEHNFQINIPARRLSMRQSNTIAYVTHAYCTLFSVADLFTLELMSGITSALYDNGYDLLLVAVDPYDNSWASKHLEAGKADGFILMTSTRKQHHIKLLAEMGAPFIAWGVPHPKYRYCTVTGDNFTGGKLATEHLIKRGRTCIGFLGGPAEELEVQHRYDGYTHALQEAGMTPDPALVVNSEFSGSSAGQAMRTLLARNAALDAVFVNSDMMAVAAMNVLREADKRIPEDVAVVGYDNLSIAEQATPPLTTVSQNIYLAGRLLAQNLLQYLKTQAITHVTVPVELVVRQSA